MRSRPNLKSDTHQNRLLGAPGVGWYYLGADLLGGDGEWVSYPDLFSDLPTTPHDFTGDELLRPVTFHPEAITIEAIARKNSIHPFVVGS